MLDLLANPLLIDELSKAWRESQPDDSAARHEEGGYILLNDDRSYAIERWPRGGASRILPPPLDANNRYNGKGVIAAFHTHPNPPIDELGREWEQAPSRTDRRWHQNRGLSGFVISATLVYEIDENANVAVIGRRDQVLKP